MNYRKIKEILIRHEGIRLKPYLCPAGKLTIAVGRNLEGKGITEREAIMMLWRDIKEAHADLYRLFGWPSADSVDFGDFSEARQLALADMRFQLGPGGLRAFKLMIAAIRAGDWAEAAKQVEDSDYFKQVPGRATWVRDNLRDG